MLARLFRRVALVLLGVLLALVASEGLLRAGAWVVRQRGEPAPTRWTGGSRRVICVGDSNTYGLYLARDQAYPQQLQRQWDSRGDLPAIEVLNLGVPGTNSSRLRDNFGRILDTFSPDLVLTMIGANDGWTVPVPIGDVSETSEQQLWKASRVFRLLYMIGRAAKRYTDGELKVEFTPPGQPDPKGRLRYAGQEIDLSYTARAEQVDDWTTALRANLAAMAAQAGTRGAQVVLVTYPSEHDVYGIANTVIRIAARETGIPLIDAGKALTAACRPETCGGLFFPDFHATAGGNEIVARTVVEGLLATPPGAGAS